MSTLRCFSQRSDQELQEKYERQMTAAQEASLKEKREKEQREEEARQRAYQEQEAHRARAASLGRKRFLEDTHRQDKKRKKKRRNQQREQMALLLQATV